MGDGGNYLLNIGPRPDGTFEPEAISCMQQVGQWLARHGNTVYGTTGGPFVVDGQYTSTRKGKQINLFLFDKKRQKSDAERAGQ